METIASYEADEILSVVPESGKRIIRHSLFVPHYSGELCFNVKINSKRLRLFKKNKSCVCCGAEGSVMLLQRHQDEEMPHLNLYALGEDGELILMTKDHIIPSSRDGGNSLSNLQTMCEFCNGLKGGFPITNEQLQTIRIKYLSLRSEGKNHKSAHHIVEKIKTEMCEQNEQLQQKPGGS